MSAPSAPSAPGAREGAIGDLVTTDFSGHPTTHRITDRSPGRSQSGILFQVTPPVPKSSGPRAWIDADWFRPAVPPAQGTLL